MYGKGISFTASGAGHAILYGTPTAADGKGANSSWASCLLDSQPCAVSAADGKANNIPIGQLADVYNICKYK